MSEKLGEVYYEAHIRGDRLPAEARRIGKNTGTVLGDSIGKATDSELMASLNKNGRRWAANLDAKGGELTTAFRKSFSAGLKKLNVEMSRVFSTNDGIDNFVLKTEDASEAVKRLSGNVALLYEKNKINKQQLDSFNSSISEYIKKHNETAIALRETTRLEHDANIARAESMDILKEQIREQTNAVAIHRADNDEIGRSEGLIAKNTNALKKLRKASKDADGGFRWKSLGHNLRQAIVIIAAIAAGGAQIAALGSAVGAGLTIFVGALASAFVGVGFLAAGIVSLSEKMSDTSGKQMPAYVGALKSLGAGFSALGEIIETKLFTPLASGFDAITASLPQLEGVVGRLASVLGSAFAGVISRITSPEGLAKIEAILNAVTTQIPLIVSSLSTFAGAIGSVFVTARPFIIDFLARLDDLATHFNDWVNSVEGKEQLREWFDNGSKILSAFTDLVGDAGKVLSSLVDKESVARTVKFLENLGKAMPFLTQLMDTLGELDIFGLAAELLAKIGDALGPYLKHLEPLMKIVNILISGIVDGVSLILNIFSVFLAPLTLVFEIFAAALERWQIILAPVMEILNELFNTLGLAAQEIIDAFVPALDSIMDAMQRLLPSPEELARIIEDEVLPAIADFTAWIKNEVVPLVEDATQALADWIDGFGGWETIKGHLDAAIRVLTIFGNAVSVALSPAIAAVKFLAELMVSLGLIKVPKIPVYKPGQYIGSQSIPGFASGTIANRATLGVFGEAGREAVVPLDRPLSQVDPAVRSLSAYAQGIDSGSNGKTVNVERGAVTVITPAKNPVLVANMVLDDIVAHGLN